MLLNWELDSPWRVNGDSVPKLQYSAAAYSGLNQSFHYLEQLAISAFPQHPTDLNNLILWTIANVKDWIQNDIFTVAQSMKAELDEIREKLPLRTHFA